MSRTLMLTRRSILLFATSLSGATDRAPSFCHKKYSSNALLVAPSFGIVGDTTNTFPSMIQGGRFSTIAPFCSQSKNSHTEEGESTNTILTFESIAEGLKKGKFRNVVFLCGAGISVSAGLPDFRTPGTGLYDNLQKYNLPYPEAIFELDFYRRSPEAFITLAKELWPTGQTYKPTISHSFIKLLEKKDMLLRCYTQNLDGLEVLANVSPDKMIECHGHFRSASCVRCRKPYDIEKCKSYMLDQGVAPVCEDCNKGIVKPDIVFFGEELPERFISYVEKDCDKCDLLLVLGTSLQVYPVAGIPKLVNCPTILMNREDVGTDFWTGNSNIDVFEQGDCDESVRKICELVGWLEELEELHKKLIQT